MGSPRSVMPEIKLRLGVLVAAVHTQPQASHLATREREMGTTDMVLPPIR